MSQTTLLLDSNAYFRLAHQIHPLLKICFGQNNYCLGILEDLDTEFNRSQRLQTKFYWVSQKQYSENRKNCFKISSAQHKAIHLIFGFINELEKDSKLGVSRVDIKALAYGSALNIPVVTDDAGMLKLTAEFEVVHMTTLMLLKVMYDENHINREKVFEVVSFWVFNFDIPKNFKKDYQSLFPGFPAAS